jgi:hypothetical protein
MHSQVFFVHLLHPVHLFSPLVDPATLDDSDNKKETVEIEEEAGEEGGELDA